MPSLAKQRRVREKRAAASKHRKGPGSREKGTSVLRGREKRRKRTQSRSAGMTFEKGKNSAEQQEKLPDSEMYVLEPSLRSSPGSLITWHPTSEPEESCKSWKGLIQSSLKSTARLALTTGGLAQRPALPLGTSLQGREELREVTGWPWVQDKWSPPSGSQEANRVGERKHPFSFKAVYLPARSCSALATAQTQGSGFC